EARDRRGAHRVQRPRAARAREGHGRHGEAQRREPARGRAGARDAALPHRQRRGQDCGRPGEGDAGHGHRRRPPDVQAVRLRPARPRRSGHLPVRADEEELAVRVGERFRVETARSVEEVEGLRTLWERVPWESDGAVLDLFLARVRSRPGVIRPFAAVVVDGDEPVAAAAGRVEATALRTSVGYRVLYAPTVRMLRVVDGGLVAPVPAAVAPLLGALDATLARGEAEAVTLPALPVDSALFAAVSRLGG